MPRRIQRYGFTQVNRLEQHDDRTVSRKQLPAPAQSHIPKFTHVLGEFVAKHGQNEHICPSSYVHLPVF